MFVQNNFEPTNLTDDSIRILEAYYSYLRQSPLVEKDRKTIRMLESLIRLSQAHARLTFHAEVTRFDAFMAVFLMETTLCTGMFTRRFDVVMDAEEYKEVTSVIKNKLKLITVLGAEEEDLEERKLVVEEKQNQGLFFYFEDEDGEELLKDVIDI